MNVAAIETTVNPSAAIHHCRNVTRKRARNFYHAIRLSPKSKRSVLFAVYAWMRRADDLVDDAGSQDADAVLQALEAFRRETDDALAARSCSHDPLWIGLSEAARSAPLRAELFHDMIGGQIDDLRRNRYSHFDELESHCRRVASSVGLICIDIWGYSNPAARTLAINRGIAFQLTNILRDVRDDSHHGRVYLPQEDFQRFGVTHAELLEWSDPRACVRMLEYQISRARRYFEQSSGLETLITPSCRASLWAMTAVYRALLRKLARDPQRCVLSEPVRLSYPRKAALAVRAKLGWFRMPSMDVEHQQVEAGCAVK